MEQPIAVQSLRWIVLLPLLGAAINGLAGATLQRQFGRRAISIIACTPVAIAFVLSLSVFVRMLGLPPEERFFLDRCWTWVDIGILHADIAFWADPLSVVMLLVVTGVGGLIHIYSTGYMHHEPAYWRFFAYLNLFMAMMLTLVLGDNLLLLFVGWEGVGLCSYALIGFWYKEWANASAGTKAFIVNRIGDFAFTVGAFLLFWSMAADGHGSVVFRDIAHHVGVLEGKTTIFGMGVATLVTLLFFIGATGKSAQIPLYVWLPDAMAGPTPVSALIHAATMVTAGIYMIARLNFLFAMAPATLQVIAWIGALTALLAATIALTQNDIKKVLAYSTVSQLGYMFMGLGAGAYVAAVFHLVTHAFFKACMFLGSGSVIHAMGGEQDMRKMGGLKRWMPITFWTFLLSTFAIAGIFPLSGFFSKDEILWKLFSGDHTRAVWILAVVGAAMTAFYMFRLVFMTFFGECRADHHTQEHLHESPPSMTYPLIVLAALAVVGGAMGVPEALGGSHRLEHWLAPVFAHAAAHEHAEAHGSASLEWLLMAFSVAVATAGILLSAAVYYWRTLPAERFANLLGGVPYRLSLHKFYVDEIYNATVVAGTFALARAAATFDRVVVDGVVNAAASVTRGVSWLNGRFDHYVVDGMVNAVAGLTMGVGTRFRHMQTGNINSYLYAIVAAVVVVMVVRLAWAG